MEHAANHRIAIVVPVHNEAANIEPLLREIRAAMQGFDYEIVYVDDGSSDASAAILAAQALLTTDLRVIRHRASCGQSAAIITGVRAADATWIATLDGDGQNDPADIPAMFEAARREERPGAPVLVAGHRQRRQDDAIKLLSSRIANKVRASLLGDATPDTGCGLKLFRRETFMSLPQFDHMHRFLPALVIRAGGVVISHPVRHRPRQAGASHYGTWGRLKVGIVDLAGVAWLQRRWNRPDIMIGVTAQSHAPADVDERIAARPLEHSH
ncbi:glycosyltransferase family 2 protein [Acidiphilium sp. PA]|uniref:glycosyltransferase family 2 protein n=1 Tax=Acidiphilium sp. PA TaxID=2871705 RepID=UPI0022432869|nr:glycosyltransferase family 2 protein [Acidiphilium sp. PA]MCW8306555.1 glycosyltransferase family 2 protein [Acidiphilium sp. PA]